MPSLDESEGRFRPSSLGSGINQANRRQWPNWLRALAKYGKRYPEAVRSLAQEEEETLTFYDFPQTMHRYIRTTNAIESLGSQRSSAHRSDRHLHDGDQLPHDCLGHDPGHPLA
jgi:transposase-like protein